MKMLRREHFAQALALGDLRHAARVELLRPGYCLVSRSPMFTEPAEFEHYTCRREADDEFSRLTKLKRVIFMTPAESGFYLIGYTQGAGVEVVLADNSGEELLVFPTKDAAIEEATKIGFTQVMFEAGHRSWAYKEWESKWGATPFSKWCQHYDYDPNSAEARIDYGHYLDGLVAVVKEFSE